MCVPSNKHHHTPCDKLFRTAGTVEVKMAEEEPGASAGEEQEEEEAPAAAAAGVDPKQDDVKPVIFIGLFIATLFTMGRLFKLFRFQSHCRRA